MLKKELSQNILNTLLHTDGISGEYTRAEVRDKLIADLGNPGMSASDSAASPFYKDPEHRVVFKNWTYKHTPGTMGKKTEREVDPKTDTVVPTSDKLVGTPVDLDL